MLACATVRFEFGSPLLQRLSESPSETSLKTSYRIPWTMDMFLTMGYYNKHDYYVDLYVNLCKQYNLPRCYTFSIVHSAWCVGLTVKVRESTLCTGNICNFHCTEKSNVSRDILQSLPPVATNCRHNSIVAKLIALRTYAGHTHTHTHTHRHCTSWYCYTSPVLWMKVQTWLTSTCYTVICCFWGSLLLPNIFIYFYFELSYWRCQ
jgi:hypothetical protein